MSRRFVPWIVGLVVLISGLRALSSTPPPAKPLTATYPLQVFPITVYFERRLDLDRHEHESLIMVFRTKNTSGSSICEFEGDATLDANGIKRSEHVSEFKVLQPGEDRSDDVEVVLNKKDNADASLSALPLNQMTISWVTERAKMCDGNLYVGPSPSVSSQN